MTSPHVRVEIREGVQSLRLDRAEKKNALTDAMYHALADAMEAAEADGGVGAHLFLGLPGTFTAGNDIGDFLGQAMGGTLPGGVQRFLDCQVRAAKPMVAAVDGLAIGIGVTLLFQCDLVYATARSMFRTPFVDLAAVPENASSLLAPKIMGHQWAFEMLCLGETFDAERALAARFVNAVLPEDAVEARAFEACRRLAAKPREALRLSRMLLRGDAAERAARSAEEGVLFAERIRSDEARAVFQAFMARKQG